MATLLHIQGSPRVERSHSRHVASTFLETYRRAHPDDRVETLDLWSEELPRFDGMVLDAKYAILHGQEHSTEQAEAWNAVVAVIDQFKAADKYLFSLPMWNFGIPYPLKHYIDVIAQPGWTFGVSEQGYHGLVVGKPVVTIYARGGAYQQSPAQAMDYQKSYLEMILKFLGFTEIHSMVVEPTLGGPEAGSKARELAENQARELAYAV